MLGRCSHEFSWPRRAPSGDYYQVCLLCATAYQYDWKSMRRGDRVDEPVADTSATPRRGGQKKPTWIPRARRVRSDIPVRYRGKNLSTWYEGKIQNISQSGVLFGGSQQLPANALVELIFEMPEEISGQKNRNVLCQGRLIRIKEATDKNARGKTGSDAAKESFGIVASILDYKFLNKQ